MALNNKDKIRALLKSIETGDPGPVAVVNEAQYIQHNPQTHEGSEGLAALFKRLSQTSPRVNVVRAFEDGAFVFAHTEYDFSRRNIGFEVFRFEDGYAVEHWDNIQKRQGLNLSGHSMVDGVTEASEPGKTEENRACIRHFVETVLIGAHIDDLTQHFDANVYVEHNPRLSDDLDLLHRSLEQQADGSRLVNYQRLHRVLADGDFVLSICEGEFSGKHSAFYDLYRLSKGLIVEHWDTVEHIAPRSDWKNSNGKF